MSEGRFGRGGLAASFALGAALFVAHANAAAPAGAEPTMAARQAHMLDKLPLKSGAVLVVDMDSGETLAEKNADTQAPVASLTKLMTALVVLDARLPGDEVLEITNDDIDRTKHTPSRLKVGTRLTRDQLLLLALMASENRAAMALSRNYPGGRGAFIVHMNSKARELGMRWTHFDDPAGLSPASVSTPRDLHRLLTAAATEPLIRRYSTQREARMKIGKRNVAFINSNRLVRRRGQWDIELQKTGFTNEAGRCLVMQTRVANRRLAMIFLDSFGKLTRYGDASRVRSRVERETYAHAHAKATAASP